MTFADLQTLITEMQPGSSGFISSTGLKYFLRMTLMDLAGGDYRFSWALREYTLTLTGASEYNLATLIPDLVSIYQIHGDSVGGYGVPFQNLHDYNLTRSGQSFTVAGTKLRFQNPPTSGTLTIPYYSKYLVIDGTTSARKLDAEAGADILVVPDELVEVIFEGILRYYHRKEKEPQLLVPTPFWDGKIVNLPPYKAALLRAQQNDTPVLNQIFDFRFSA